MDHGAREDLAAEAALCSACSFADNSGIDLDPSAHTEACQAADIAGIDKAERRQALEGHTSICDHRPHPDEEAAATSFAVVVNLDDGRSLLRRVEHPDNHADEFWRCRCAGCRAWDALEDLLDATTERVNALGQRILTDSPELPGDRRTNTYPGWEPVTAATAAALAPDAPQPSTASAGGQVFDIYTVGAPEHDHDELSDHLSL